MSNRKIGILGGVFDPVHNGHLSVAVLAREFFGLDEVLFVPSGVPPHKSTVTASADDRLNMLKLALTDVDGCEIWDGELRREGYSYTIDTLKELGDIHRSAEFYFIMGADNLPEIHKWRRFEDIIKKVTFCVTERPGFDIDCREELSSASIKTFPGPMWGASSTMIREYLGRGYSCKFLMPDAVIEYIIKNGSYGYSNG